MRWTLVVLAALGASCVPFLDTSPIDSPGELDSSTDSSDIADTATDSPESDVDAAADSESDADAGLDSDETRDADVAPDAPPGTLNPCVSGAPRCDEQGFLRIVCDGVPTLQNCTFGCVDGECQPTCHQRNGCSADGGAVLECDGDSPEVDQECPEGLACVGGGCRGAGDCEPRTSRCNPAGDLALCDETGAEELVIPCPGAACLQVWADDDGDGWGDPASGQHHACALRTGWADNASDCDDSVETGPETPCAGFSVAPPGEFLMGTPSGEVEPIPEFEQNQQLVAFDRPLLVMQTEVTQALWAEASGTVTNPSFHSDCPTCPVERVNWFEALEFANRLSDREGRSRCYVLSECGGSFGAGCDDGDQFCPGGFSCDRVEFAGTDCDGYRLPTEAEWEYFTRAGNPGPFAGSPSDIAWYRDSVEDGRPQPVGGLAANAWGIHDAQGNVAEWVMDVAVGPHSGSLDSPTVNPLVFGTASDVSDLVARVTRGGGFASTENACRSASRGVSLPQDRVFSVGLRLVRTQTEAR